MSDRPGGLYRRKAIAKFFGPVILAVAGGGAPADRGLCPEFHPEKKRESDGGIADAAPHYHGHRERFRDAGADALSEYELLELLLFRALPRRDVKPFVKTLLAKFGSFAEVIAAPQARLAEVKGLGGGGITELKIVQAAASRLLRGAITKRPVLSSWSNVLDYAAPPRVSPIASSSA